MLRRAIYKRPLIALPIYLTVFTGVLTWPTQLDLACGWSPRTDWMLLGCGQCDGQRLLFSEPGLTKKQYVVRWEAGGGGQEELKLFSITST